MNIAYRFRIYPNREQEVLLAKTFGCCRFLYNQMLNDKIREYEATKNMKAMSQCMHFGKSVMDNSYGKFRELLEYKLTWRGKKLVRVDRFFPSSKKCCKCGSVKKELKLSDRVYLCRCGNRIDRDLNAAINIREEARRRLLAG